MIASIVWDVDPILFKVGSWEVRWYGLMWGLGFILAYEMVSRLFKKEKYPEEWRKLPPAGILVGLLPKAGNGEAITLNLAPFSKLARLPMVVQTIPSLPLR